MGEWDALAWVATASGHLRVLTEDELAALTGEIGARFVADTSCGRWWTCLRVEAETVAYGDADGLATLGTLVGSQEPAVLVVTDGAPCPAGAIAGTVSHLVELLRASTGCEYALVADDRSWMVFDTHHHELLVVRSGA